MTEEEIEKKSNEVADRLMRNWESSVVHAVSPAQRTFIVLICLVLMYIHFLRYWFFVVMDSFQNLIGTDGKGLEFWNEVASWYGYHGNFNYLLRDILFLITTFWFLLKIQYPSFRDQKQRVLEREKNQVSQKH